MKFKYKQLESALNFLRMKASLGSLPEAEIELTMREENSGEIGECLIVTATIIKAPASYDDYKTPTTQEYTLEIFPTNENRPPRIVTVETKELT